MVERERLPLQKSSFSPATSPEKLLVHSWRGSFFFFNPQQRRQKNCLMAYRLHPLGTPRWRYDEHSNKSSLSYETKVYRTSRRKPYFRRWCLLASRQLRTIYKASHPGLCFALAATWNLHTTQPRTLPQLMMRLSVSPVCCKQRIESIEW
jgi:hypothetical protein